jgi:hypothetical protein
VLVEDDTVGASHHSAAAAADQRAHVHHGAFHVGGHRFVRAQLLELFAQTPPSQIELGSSVLGVVGSLRK